MVRQLGPLGPFFLRFGARLLYNLGRALQAKVPPIIVNGGWSWPRGRSGVTREILDHTPTALLPQVNEEDSVSWTLTRTDLFSVKSAWDALRQHRPIVSWHKVVWFKAHVPRWAIIQWLIILGRLATKDRIWSWGIEVNEECVLCHSGNESHSHLFFQCSFASSVWRYFLEKAGISRLPLPFDQEVSWFALHKSGCALYHLVPKFAVAAVLYHLWLE